MMNYPNASPIQERNATSFSLAWGAIAACHLVVIQCCLAEHLAIFPETNG
jgi:hypothetical protein